jgi:hypothetical protein
MLVLAGWAVQDADKANLAAGRGVAVREFILAAGHGRADYLLFVDRKAAGVLEAKPAGTVLSNVEPQRDDYADGMPNELEVPIEPLPFTYMSTGRETRSRMDSTRTRELATSSPFRTALVTRHRSDLEALSQREAEVEARWREAWGRPIQDPMGDPWANRTDRTGPGGDPNARALTGPAPAGTSDMPNWLNQAVSLGCKPQNAPSGIRTKRAEQEKRGLPRPPSGTGQRLSEPRDFQLRQQRPGRHLAASYAGFSHGDRTRRVPGGAEGRGFPPSCARAPFTVQFAASRIGRQLAALRAAHRCVVGSRESLKIRALRRST